ncbi:adenylate kinase family protein [Jatrophihabitans fulvus]
MRLLLIGAPGSGKGTQGTRIAALYGAAHLSTGDLLRREVANGTAVGGQVRDLLAAGELVPDEIVLRLLLPAAVAAADGAGYVLDGFPRTLGQATVLDSALEDAGCGLRRVIQLDVPRRHLVARMLRRGADEGRADDTAEVIRRRLDVYDTATAPVLEHYRSAGLLRVVDGSGAPAAVTRDVLDELPDLARSVPA